MPVPKPATLALKKVFTWTSPKLQVRVRDGRRQWSCPLGHTHPSELSARNCRVVKDLELERYWLYRQAVALELKLKRAQERVEAFGGLEVSRSPADDVRQRKRKG